MLAVEVKGEGIWAALANGGWGKQHWWTSERWEMGEGSGSGRRWVDVGACRGGGRRRYEEGGAGSRKLWRRAATMTKRWEESGDGGGEWRRRVEKFLRLHLFLSAPTFITASRVRLIT